MTTLSGLKVLIVDDIKDNQLLVERYLQKVGVQDMDFAENGAEAVEKAKQETYDCILMDLQMPIMDGMEATRTLRRIGYTRPIWALTAHALREEREKCLAQGFDKHFAKPLDRKALIDDLELLHRRKQSEQHA
ncbi:response regulator [Bdellovibrio bacteriovorus]|uniref:Response regulatory domain-containing protein n=1 Tax=Bdellovibrio bacteriovorus TaxID=959 RepID=A0A150WFN5_BDEBC|nr:response regulator [Bdellovibrio bacteriovorus]KYG61937.1 hypothetical protein AZI85_06925 [Bdellovibrio bacteriovorus]